MTIATGDMLRKTALILLFVALPGTVMAQGVEPELDEDQWAFGAGLYLFAANTKGVTTVGAKAIETDLSFTEAIDSLEGAFSFHFTTLSPSRVGIGVDYL